jgi:glycerophosphoryl diester phosphodiesterase
VSDPAEPDAAVPPPARPPLLAVAHRSGNTVAGLRQSLEVGVDLVEADVHAYRGRLEVRHQRSLAGLPFLWDREGVVPRRPHHRLELAELVEALGDDHRLMIDLKGVHPQLAPKVARLLRETSPDRSLTVCTKSWWMLDAFDVPVRKVLSAATRRGVARLLARVADGPVDGVSVRLSLLTPELVALLHRSTDLVMAWPVDTPQALALARRVDADAVISKDLDLLRGVLADR